MSIIYIMPTPSVSPYGVTDNKSKKKLVFEGKNDTEMSKTIEIDTTYNVRKNFSNPTFTTSISVDTTNKKYNIFSDEKMANPYFKKPSELPSNWSNSNIEKSEYISEQDYYEMKHNVAPGTYITTLNDMLNPSINRTKFMNFRMSFSEINVTILDTSKPEDELTYLAILKSGKSYSSVFANSLQDFYTTNTNAKFYIADIAQETEAKIRYERQKINLMALVNTVLESFTDEKLYKLCVLLDIVNIKSTRVEYESRFIDLMNSTNTTEIVKDKFKRLYKMATTANLTDDYELEFVIKEALNKRVLIASPEAYLWMSQKGNNRYEIAKTYDRLLKYFKDSKNKETYEMLKEELQTK